MKRNEKPKRERKREQMLFFVIRWLCLFVGYAVNLPHTIFSVRSTENVNTVPNDALVKTKILKWIDIKQIAYKWKTETENKETDETTRNQKLIKQSNDSVANYYCGQPMGIRCTLIPIISRFALVIVGASQRAYCP